MIQGYPCIEGEKVVEETRACPCLIATCPLFVICQILCAKIGMYFQARCWRFVWSMGIPESAQTRHSSKPFLSHMLCTRNTNRVHSKIGADTQFWWYPSHTSSQLFTKHKTSLSKTIHNIIGKIFAGNFTSSYPSICREGLVQDFWSLTWVGLRIWFSFR